VGLCIALVALAFIGLLETTPTPLESGLIASYPIRRALRLQPSQALRADA
jgi:hypothetical protein